MIEFSKNQQDYINAPLNKNIYLRACPGAGKTEVIAAKVAMEARRWQHFPSGIAVLSFSRSATAELSDRIAKARRGNTNTHPHFVGTVDSFVLNHLVAPFAHSLTGYGGKDGDYSLKVVGPEALCFHRIKYPIEKQPIFANRYDWDAAVGRYLFWHASEPIMRKLNNVVLADWQIDHLKSAKVRFNAAGFATYKDVQRLAIEILTKGQFKERLALLVRRFPSIIIDECQDLSAEQIMIFTHLADLGVRFHLVGDLAQAIYGFRNCFPAAVSDFIAYLGCAEMPLVENFRSGQCIVDLHGKLVQASKTQGKANYAQVTCYLMEYKNCPSEVLGQFDGLAVDHQDSVIVARGHSTLSKMRARNTEPGPAQLLAAAINAYVSDAPGSLYNALTIFARYLAENCMECETLGVDRFHRPARVSFAESWNQFLSECLLQLAAKGLGKQDVTWQQWCKLLRVVLSDLVASPSYEEDCQRIVASLKTKKHSAPPGLGAEQVAPDEKNVQKIERVRRLATIHEVKGETHDLTMLVSSAKQGEGSHWKEWLDDPHSEAARFAYVASSRPRHILIWAVKALKAPERKRLADLGFYAYP
jgi:hypothetical protein